MNWHLWSLISVMVIAGGFGGLVNYFYCKDDKATIWKSMILGLGASFLVPLFLNMISSSLLVDSKEDPYKILVFMGFCLIAAISSKAFIGTISDKIMEVAKQAEDTALEAKEQIQKVKEIVDPLATKETEQDYTEEQSTDNSELIIIEAIGEEGKAILSALDHGKHTFRAIISLSRETKMSTAATLSLLHKLESLGLIGRLKTNNTIHYFLTMQGRKLISPLIWTCKKCSPT